MGEENNILNSWAAFEQTGSIYDYLNYISQQKRGKDSYADCNNGPCAETGEGGRGGSDPDDFFP